MQFSEFIAEQGKVLNLSAGSDVFRQGDRDRNMYLVKEGMLKALYLSEQGSETIKSFIAPGNMIGSLESLYHGGDCSFGLRCLEDSRLVRFDFDALFALSRKDLEIAGLVIEFLLAFAQKKERRERAFLTASAEERYRLLLEESPEVVERVTQKDIALYLGITPVALSRIRQRMGKTRSWRNRIQEPWIDLL